MNQPIKWVENQMPKSSDSQLKVMDLEEVKKARAFHKSFPQYSKTPLRKLENMAGYLGGKGNLRQKTNPTVSA